MLIINKGKWVVLGGAQGTGPDRWRRWVRQLEANLTWLTLLSVTGLSLSSVLLHTTVLAPPPRSSCPITNSFLCFIHSSVYRVLMLFRLTATPRADHQLSMLQHSLSPSVSWTSKKGAGPQMRTVPSSEALASSPGRTGFQLTQLTVRV